MSTVSRRGLLALLASAAVAPMALTKKATTLAPGAAWEGATASGFSGLTLSGIPVVYDAYAPQYYYWIASRGVWTNGQRDVSLLLGEPMDPENFDPAVRLAG